MNARRIVLRVEELGSRTLPSSLTLTRVPPAPHVVPAESSRIIPQAGVRFFGLATGVFAAARPQQQLGTDYTIMGTADLAHIGHVGLAGQISSVGPGQPGQAVGTLSLNGRFGSITVKLTGPVQPALSPLPAHFQYTVLASSGIYANVHSTGTVDLTIGSGSTGSFSLTFHPAAA
jgi:hypothetical protein